MHLLRVRSRPERVDGTPRQHVFEHAADAVGEERLALPIDDDLDVRSVAIDQL